MKVVRTCLYLSWEHSCVLIYGGNGQGRSAQNDLDVRDLFITLILRQRVAQRARRTIPAPRNSHPLAYKVSKLSTYSS